VPPLLFDPSETEKKVSRDSCTRPDVQSIHLVTRPTHDQSLETKPALLQDIKIKTGIIKYRGMLCTEGDA
jgi:hypothetical protein